MLLLLAFAFLSGLVTILAPCIWPLLPIILSSSAASPGKYRPLGITAGIMASFAVFTLTISALVRIFDFDPNVLRYAAVVIIGALGLMLIIPALSKLFEILVSKLAGLLGSRIKQGAGFLPGFVTGLSLGIVWSPCAGPILAAIAALTVTGQVTYQVVLITLAYVAGVGIPLFFFAYGGQRFIAGSRRLSPYTGVIQRVFGVIMILTAIAIYTNYDKVLQVKLLETFPFFDRAVNSFESKSAVTQELDKLLGGKSAQTKNSSGLFNQNTPAPELVGITHWLNSDPLTLEQLRGRVVMIDFWTYTCINCIRTLPYVTGWYEKYKDQGFVVIGVHAPEFEFEKKTANVEEAITRYGIRYPVAQDNNFATWRAYNNRYWPAHYLIDAEGNIRHTHFGEGEYEATEEAIRILLQEAGHDIAEDEGVSLDESSQGGRKSPETYLGSARMSYLSPGGRVGNGEKFFQFEPKLSLNRFSLGGTWQVAEEHSVSGKNAVLEYNFQAQKVFLVMKPTEGGRAKRVKVYLDGALVSDAEAGADVNEGIVTVDTDRLYELINLEKNSQHLLRLEFPDEGTEVYAFTFG